MHGELVREVPALRHSYGVNLTDYVGYGCVGGRELLAVPPHAWYPAYLDPVAVSGDAVATAPADGIEGVIVYLAAGDGGHLIVQQPHQGPDHPRLGLPSLAEENHVLARQDSILHLGNNTVLKPDDPWEELLSAPDHPYEVASHLLLDRYYPVTRRPEFTDGSRFPRAHPLPPFHRP